MRRGEACGRARASGVGGWGWDGYRSGNRGKCEAYGGMVLDRTIHRPQCVALQRGVGWGALEVQLEVPAA
jgi:hypothetical protein